MWPDLNDIDLSKIFTERKMREQSTCSLHLILFLFQILVRGSPESTEALAEYCSSQSLVSGTIFRPDINDVVDATTEGFIYQVEHPFIKSLLLF